MVQASILVEGIMSIDEYQATLQSWIHENGEALVDIYLPHSGGGGTLYLLKSPNHVETAVKFAASMAERYGDGRAIITAFRSDYYPLRGNADESLLEKIRLAWGGDRWYSIANLEDAFPEPLRIIGSGDTQQELVNDLADVMSNWKGHFIGFGEHPFDTEDWAVRNQVDVIEISVGKPRWEKADAT